LFLGFSLLCLLDSNLSTSALHRLHCFVLIKFCLCDLVSDKFTSLCSRCVLC
ncbi:unnamed protein product, partial [Brassica napus]